MLRDVKDDGMFPVTLRKMCCCFKYINDKLKLYILHTFNLLSLINDV